MDSNFAAGSLLLVNQNLLCPDFSDLTELLRVPLTIAKSSPVDHHLRSCQFQALHLLVEAATSSFLAQSLLLQSSIIWFCRRVTLHFHFTSIVPCGLHFNQSCSNEELLIHGKSTVCTSNFDITAVVFSILTLLLVNCRTHAHSHCETDHVSPTLATSSRIGSTDPTPVNNNVPATSGSAAELTSIMHNVGFGGEKEVPDAPASNEEFTLGGHLCSMLPWT